MALTLAIANQKGGVGKTTSTVNLGYLLRKEHGRRVLVVDCDPQASLTVYYGQNPYALEEGKGTLYWALLKDVPIDQVILSGDTTRPDLVPASLRLSTGEEEMLADMNPSALLRDALAPIQEAYDFILLDCPPNLTRLMINALTAADAVLVPVKTDYLSAHGIGLIFDTVEKVRRRANPRLRVLGVLPTIYNAQANHDRQMLEELRHVAANRKLRVFDPINRSTAFDRASIESRPTAEMLPNAPGVENYRALALELTSHAAVA